MNTSSKFKIAYFTFMIFKILEVKLQNMYYLLAIWTLTCIGTYESLAQEQVFYLP